MNVPFRSKLHAFLPVMARLDLVLVFVAGVLLATGLPPLSWIVVSALGLSFVALLEMQSPSPTGLRALLRGWAFGFGYFVFAYHWIGYAFLVDADAYLWMMPFAVGGLALFMAFYWALAHWMAFRLARAGFPVWLLLPVCLAAVELLRGYLFTGFPWAAPGLIADGMGGVLQFSSVVGMPGLTLLVLCWGMWPVAAVLEFQIQRRRAFVPLLLLASLPAIWLWGEWRLHGAILPTDGPLVRLVQPNISQSDKWRASNAEAIFEGLMAQSFEPRQRRPDVVVWPESAVPFLLDETPIALERIGAQLQVGETLLAGAIRRNPQGQYFTSIMSIVAGGRIDAVYDKWRLVPGGEYLPLAWMLEPLGFRKVVNLPEAFSAGEGPRNINVAGVGPATMLICYEVIFPHRLVPEVARPRWIVNVTNDGWFGASVGPYQHLAQVRMRAVEQGLAIARAANTGVSAIFDPFGQVVAESILGEKAIVDAVLPPSLSATIFARFGLLATLLCFAAVFTISSLFAYLLGVRLCRK